MNLANFSKAFLNYVRAQDQIAGKCPECGQTFRLGEVELFYIPDRKKDFLTEVRKMKEDFEEEKDKIIKDRLRRSRSSLMGSLFEQVRPYLPGFKYEPGDLRSIWKPVDYVCFNGLSLKREVDSVTFIDVKTGRSSLTPEERSIEKAVEKGRVSFETVTHPGPAAPKELSELPLLKIRNLRH